MASNAQLLREVVDRLTRAGGDHLLSVVLYGVRAHGDYATAPDHIHILVVLDDLGLEAVASVGEPIRWWRKNGKPWPRLLSPASIREASDVFPIELLDITAHHEVLYGDSPFDELEIQDDHLRLQCERELREKLMRLQEGYIETAGKAKRVRRLMIDSYLAFANVFRGCLHLIGDDVPTHTIEVVREFCRRAEVDAAPFEEIDGILRGRPAAGTVEDTFRSYYEQLQRAVDAIDQFRPKGNRERRAKRKSDEPEAEKQGEPV